VALGDSLTEGIGDPVAGGWRGWAALLADGLGPAGTVDFHNLASSGARTRDVLERQTPRALALRPDLASVIVGVNDTLRRSYDIHAVAAGLSRVYAAFAAQGVPLVTACLPDPGALLRLPRPLARPLARRQQSVNEVVHALSARHAALHLHLTDGDWLADPAMWSADRLHPGERGHRMVAVRVHRLLADAGLADGAPPRAEPELPPPTWAARMKWLATKGTAWVLRRSTDLLPQLAALAGQEVRHWARGTTARLDVRASRACAAALAALTEGPDDGRPGPAGPGAVLLPPAGDLVGSPHTPG
jgi:lysophospholipase L1-like esterase